MLKALITGASGFLGSYINYFAKKTVITCATFWNHPPVNEKEQWFRLDLTNYAGLDQFLNKIRPDVILHLAAITDIDQCQLDKESAKSVNIEATKCLVNYAATKRKRMIFISSDMVFDGKKGMYREEDAVAPVSFYGEAKAIAEEIVRSHCSNWVNVRAALIYGKPLGGGSSFTEWMRRGLENGKQVFLYSDQYRTPIFVENLARIIIELIDHSFIGDLHCGGANRIDRFSFGKQFCKFGHYDPNLLVPTLIKQSKAAATRPVDVSLDISKAKSILKTRLLSTEEGLLQMFAGRKKQETEELL